MLYTWTSLLTCMQAQMHPSVCTYHITVMTIIWWCWHIFTGWCNICCHLQWWLFILFMIRRLTAWGRRRWCRWWRRRVWWRLITVVSIRARWRRVAAITACVSFATIWCVFQTARSRITGWLIVCHCDGGLVAYSTVLSRQAEGTLPLHSPEISHILKLHVSKLNKYFGDALTIARQNCENLAVKVSYVNYDVWRLTWSILMKQYSDKYLNTQHW